MCLKPTILSLPPTIPLLWPCALAKLVCITFPNSLWIFLPHFSPSASCNFPLISTSQNASQLVEMANVALVTFAWWSLPGGYILLHSSLISPTLNAYGIPSLDSVLFSLPLSTQTHRTSHTLQNTSPSSILPLHYAWNCFKKKLHFYWEHFISPKKNSSGTWHRVWP